MAESNRNNGKRDLLSMRNIVWFTCFAASMLFAAYAVTVTRNKMAALNEIDIRGGTYAAENSFPEPLKKVLGSKLTCALSDIVVVDLSGATISDSSVMEILGWRSLDVFIADDTSIGDSALSSIPADSSLSRVSLQRTNVTDSCFRSLSRLKDLSTLNLSECRINGSGLIYLVDNKLESLGMSGIHFSRDGVLRLSELHSVTALYLNDSSFSDSDVSLLAGMPQLEWLSLIDTQISDSGLASLVHFPQLKTLFLSGTRITDSGVNSLSNLTMLRSLSIGSTKITPSGVRLLKERLPDTKIYYR